MKAAAAILALILCAGAAEASLVTVKEGSLRGQGLPDGSTVFRGIPYAAPPVGDLRWKPPAPVTAWRGVRDAVQAPHPCMQANEGWNAAAAAYGSEDCLYLSLHTPKHKKGAKLPVFVWIHGGSNRAGSGFGTADSPLYQRGIIVVGIEYRLGVFGFLGAPELAAESPQHSSGNYALLDQIAALHWVKDNITAFGGDPANITIGGQSAGAVDVGQLMRSPLARGLFAKAIQESGAPALPRSAAVNEKLGSDFLVLLGLPAGAQGLKALRALPAETVLSRAAELKGPEGDNDALWIASTADGWVMTGTRNDIYRNGEQAPVPLLIGDNTREFVLDLPDGGRGLIRNLFKQNADRALAAYGFKDDTAPPADPVLGNAATQAITDVIFRCPINQLVQWHVKAGAPVWRYQFGVPQPGLAEVRHNAELAYLFNAPTVSPWPPVQDYWANFIKTGDPNGAGLPAWPQAGRDTTFMAFMPEGWKLGSDPQGAVCRLLAETNSAR